MKRLLLALIMLTIASNAAWAYYYSSLWYADARADGARDQAEHYIHNGCKN